MEVGKATGLRRPWPIGSARRTLGLCLVFLAGCATDRSELDRALQPAPGPEPSREAISGYVLGFPDKIDLRVDGQPDLAGIRPIAADGRIDLANFGQPRVESKTLMEAAAVVAGALGVSPDRVHLRVSEFNSQQVYLFGQVIGLQRALPYRGPETVPELLRRAGGVTSGAELQEVFVVRDRIIEGRPPQVFHLNGQDLLKNPEPGTSLRLQPYDQVFIGEAHRAKLARCFAPCLRPLFETVSGLRNWSRESSPSPLAATDQGLLPTQTTARPPNLSPTWTGHPGGY
jgi:protein involved in polysaccharide export with SLBB domain